ncbi:hypothetical protein GOV04_05135 [Candidatus Woesearchaeota archaeon]|nr:hypothetical protein [Candidatus Woesearchaeota archaeon]
MGGVEVSTVQSVGQYNLAEPISIACIPIGDTGYQAMHLVPSNFRPEGCPVKGYGRTKKNAQLHLLEQLKTWHQTIQSDSSEIKTMREHLKTIFA